MRWHSTGNGPADRSGEPPACFRNPKDLTKVITVIIKKRAIGWIFRQLLRLHSFRFNQQKMLILPTNSRMQIHSQYVSWQYPRIFQTDRIAGSLLQRKLYRTDIWLFVFFFLCVWGPSLQQQFSIVTEKSPSSKDFQPVCYSHHTEIWKNYATSMHERHKRGCFSGICLSETI